MTSSSPRAIVDLPSAAVDPWSAAPFDADTAQKVQRLLQQLDASQRLWLSGFLAGSLSTALPQTVTTAHDAEPAVTILYGSQSGNCERLAKEIGESLAMHGIPYLAVDMLDCRKSHLQDARALLVVVSTHGEGDPPDRAIALHELLHSRKAPALGHLKYAVLALGDSSYEKFCETGRQFDSRLAALGAQPFHARIDCDVDFEQPARQWITGVIEHLAREQGSAAVPQSARTHRPIAPVSTAYTRKNPFHAPVLTNQRLTARTSSKDVRHIELSLDGSGIHYEPGDAIGIVPRNDAARVATLLQALPYGADAAVTIDSAQVPLQQALLERYDIGRVTRAFIEKYCERTNTPDLAAHLRESQDGTASAIRDIQLADLLAAHPPSALDANSFVELLRPLAPRLYSIASSQRATPDEVHLTVALVQFTLNGQSHFGLASKQFADLQGDDATAPIYLHRNPNFRLPADTDVPIIMIGPGTGIAPFRGFLAEREALGGRGRNWLFFGDRSFRSDFLYQTEWLDYRKRGVLHRIELAFSRDQTEKVYVQHRMREHGRELYEWLQNGAHLYVCGDAEHMAADVQHALQDILQEHGGRSAERAAEDLLELQRDRRYQRDVY